MEDQSNIIGIAPFAAVAVLIAGLAWFAVGAAAGKRARTPTGGHVFSLLAGAAYLTGVAFVLAFLAWLT